MSSVARYMPAASWSGYDSTLREILRRSGVVNVCEIGAGADPRIGIAEVDNLGIRYTIVDVSAAELRKAPSGYSAVVADATAPGADMGGPYDLIFSRTVAEHVSDARAFHANVFKALEPGGWALHFFPTLFSPPFVANRILPEGLSERLVTRLWPRRASAGSAGKFAARYEWCRGPTKRQLARFAGLGYEIEQYVGFFGHEYYDPFLPSGLPRGVIARIQTRLANPYLTSYAYVVLRRPESSSSPRLSSADPGTARSSS